MKGIQGTSNKTYRQLMGNGLRYEIPKFQRDYTWEAENWDDLWQDIKALLSNEDTEHYMGYLVLQTANNKEFQVIDGQQRLTTMSILILATLRCLNDLIEKNVDARNNQRRKESLLNSYIGYIDPVTLISNNKLQLNRNSNDYYKQYLVLLRDLPLRNTNASEKHMRECFYWYYERIKKEFTNGESLAAFIDNIVDKLFFTVIEVTDQLNAFKVFETFGLIRNLNDTADIYLAIQDPGDNYWKDKPDIRKFIKELKLFQIKQTNSLFLSAIKNLNNDQFAKLARICSVVSFRYNVIGGFNPNIQEDIYNSVALKIASSKNFSFQDFQGIYVDDSTFKNAFSVKEFKSTTRNHKIVKYLLAKIEKQNFNNEIDPESDLFTIEHILPENADDGWGEFTFDEINRSVYRIGNLTLLERKLNQQGEQKRYSEKIKLYAKSQSELTRSIPFHYHSWDESKLAARQTELAKYAGFIWKIQELSK